MSTIIKPFSWLLLALYNLFNNYGVAIIMFSLIVKLLTLPFNAKSKKGLMRQTQLQPRLKELEKKHAGNKQKYNEEVTRLYQEEGISPLSGCLWTLIPLPVLLALYSVIRQPLTNLMKLTEEQIELVGNTLTNIGVEVAADRAAYSQITLAQGVFENFEAVKAVVPEVLKIDFSFLGLNLADIPKLNFFLYIDNWSFREAWPYVGLFLIPIISAVLTYLSSKISQKMSPSQNAESNQTGQTMMIMMPLMSLWIGFAMPASIGIYWIANSVFSVIQDVLLTKHYRKILAAEESVREEKRRVKEAELEAKRQETERLRAENGNVRNPNTSRRKIQGQEKQMSVERQNEYSKKDLPETIAEEPSRVGERRYARGRAYVADRFENSGKGTASVGDDQRTEQ